jgi:hypothetical protein
VKKSYARGKKNQHAMAGLWPSFPVTGTACYSYNIFRKIFLTITTTIIVMNSFMAIILDILKAPSMQISIWKWEIHMIARYGLDWRYKEPWERS